MNNSLGRKRIVDIYFVLYLAALIFLLPSRKDIKSVDIELTNNVYQSDFYIYADKNILTCSLVKDSSGIRIMSIDSVNSLYCSGNVKDVKFDFTIEDRSLNQQLRLSSGNQHQSKYFRFEEHEADQSVTFFWQPPTYDLVNKSYMVYVTATGKLASSNGSSNNNDERTVTFKTKFALDVVYLNRQSDIELAAINQRMVDSIRELNLIQQNTLAQFIPENIEMRPIFTNVNSIAYERWKNDVFVSIPQIETYFEYPKIKVFCNPENNGGTAYIAGIDNNTIKITGRTPNTGSMKVEIYLRARQNKQRWSSEFWVNPQPIGEPILESEMYPDVTYKISPKLPMLGDITTKALIRDIQTQRERAVSMEGNDFIFKPSLDDIGKSFYLERYINGNLYGQKYGIRVNDFPEPEILKLQTGENKIRIETRSYGMYNGRDNIVKLEVTGNAKYWEDFGKPPKSTEDPYTFTQYFYITPIKNNVTFAFKVSAIDQRGRRSQQKTYGF